MFEQRLRQILHPPSSPLEKPVSDDWVAAEAVLGPLPSDFKRFVTQYGTGCIDQFIWVFNPASGNSYLNLTTAGTRQLRAFSDMMGGEFGTTIGVTRIVPFGITDNGDLLAWQVRGKFETWTIDVYDARAPERRTYTMTFCDFLVGLLAKHIECDLFPEDFPSLAPRFDVDV